MSIDNRNRPLKMHFNTYIETAIQDYLPIIGNVMPSRTIQMFDNAALTGGTITYTGDGTLTADYMAAYHSDSCFKISMVDGDTGVLTITPKTAIDMTVLSTKTNEYAKIKRTGKSANAQDRLWTVLNAMVRGMTYNILNYIAVVPQFYSGDTMYATHNTWSFSPTSFSYKAWQKEQGADYLNPTGAAVVYINGFTSDNWKNITKIVFTILCNDVSAPETVSLYLQDFYIALPYYDAVNAPSAYYPQINAGNAIYVSQYFGHDSFGAGTRASPVRTIEKGISITTGSTPYIVLLDGATYKPIALDGSSVGIKETLARETTIIADYLETPIISAAPGLLDENGAGARAIYRNDFYQFYGTGSTYVVKQDGSGPGGYQTITAAYGAASDGDCVEIQDNGIYNEAGKLTIGKQVVIQSAAGFMPTWQHTANDQILKVTDTGVRIQGIIFKGTYQNTGNAIEITKEPFIKDCTFMNFGSDTTPGFNIIHDMEGTQGKTVHNCLFVDNAECVVCIASESGASGGTKNIINCRALMKGSTANNIFIGAGKAKSGTDLKIISMWNECTSSVGNGLGRFFNIQDSSGTANIAIAYMLGNDTNMISNLYDANSVKIQAYILNNFFHDNLAIIFLNLLLTEQSYIYGNYFKNIQSAIDVYLQNLLYLSNNIFNSCLSGITTGQDDVSHIINNIFINCSDAFVYTNTNGCTLSNFILVNNIAGIYSANGNPAAAVNLSNSIIYNSPFKTAPGSGTAQPGTNLLYDDPSFRNPALDDFSWNGLSNIEVDASIFAAGWGALAFINPAGAKLNFMFMQLTGFITLPTIATDNENVSLTYCTLDGAQCGVNESVNNCTQQGVLYENNGIAQRLARTTLAGGSTIKNVIAINNGVGQLIRSGAAISNITDYENDYGIQGVDYGYFAQLGALKAFLTVSNSIFTLNKVVDYALNQDAVNCLFYSMWYDTTPSTAQNLILDPDYLFPAIKKMGYMVNSDAFLKSTVAGENIGARNLFINNSRIWGDLYEFQYVGTVDDNDQFYALENPQGIQHDTVPINNESVRMIDGSYVVSPTAYPREFTFKWLTPGAESKISDALKQSLDLAFQTFWIVGFDFGAGDFTYYKVDKSSPISFEAQSYVFSGIPYGSTSIKVIEMPGFVIQDYITC